MASRGRRGQDGLETARPATPADIGALALLWEAAVSELDGQRGGSLLASSLIQADTASFLTSALTDPERIVVLGFIDHVAIGLASAYANRRGREPVTTLELIYTDPLARQVGVGEAMLDVVTAWSRDRGFVGVDAPALPGNRAAKSFFETHGFQARLLIMHRPSSRTVEAGPAGGEAGAGAGDG